MTGLTAFIRDLLGGNSSLRDLWLKGEVTDFKRAYSGHCYFKLKDAGALINCVMFRGRASRVDFDVTDGQMLLARGHITVYEKGGNYQLLVEQLKPVGMGDIYLEFLRLKEELEKKGYFKASRKRPIPYIPKAVGIATSTVGAGFQDMQKIIHSRFPGVDIYISPTTVQGTDAPSSIVKSLDILNRLDPVDVIILGRGGGSFEDLNCFNHRLVAEGVYNSRKPVISAVGHETDYTICDMVADVRAETPTAAAQLVVPDRDELTEFIEKARQRLASGLSRKYENLGTRLLNLHPRRGARAVNALINHERQALDYGWDGILQLSRGHVQRQKTRLDHLAEKLEALSPERVLARGYALVYEPRENRFLRSAEGMAKGAGLEIRMHDGIIPVEVTGEPVARKGAYHEEDC